MVRKEPRGLLCYQHEHVCPLNTECQVKSQVDAIILKYSLLAFVTLLDYNREISECLSVTHRFIKFYTFSHHFN